MVKKMCRIKMFLRVFQKILELNFVVLLKDNLLDFLSVILKCFFCLFVMVSEKHCLDWLILISTFSFFVAVTIYEDYVVLVILFIFLYWVCLFIHFLLMSSVWAGWEEHPRKYYGCSCWHAIYWFKYFWWFIFVEVWMFSNATSSKLIFLSYNIL